MNSNIYLPSYLQDVGPVNHYYGKLSYDDDKDYWVINGEPCVVQMAKKLFPGSEGRGRGVAKFKTNTRTLGELNWLMQRYPLEIDDISQWNKVIERTRKHVLQREYINKFPQKIEPSKTFINAELKEFQKEGVGHLLQNRRTLLADDMGLGKSLQALAFSSHINAFPMIIVVMPHLMKNWENEIKKFLKVPISEGENLSLIEEAATPQIHFIKGLRPYELPSANIYVIHYLLLRGWKNYLPKMGFKLVVYDEIQELRHSGTEKYSAASLLSESCDNVIGLSGTPIYNHGAEIWNVMNIIDYHCLGDWDSFTREWCYGYGSDMVVDPQLLGEHLKREGLMLRRTKEQVLKELPPKRRVVQEIDSDDTIFNNLIKDTLEKVNQLDNIKNPLEKGRLLERIAEDTRRATGVAKAPYVCDFVEMLLEGEEKILLFAYHHDVMDVYKDKLAKYNPVFITGRETKEQKERSVEAFMSGQTNICCISLRAAAGLNMQRATCVVNGELDWSPAIHSQCEDRAHRIGQEDSVLCYYLVTSQGSDQNIQEALGLKVSQFVGIMGDKVESENDKLLAQSAASQHLLKIVDKLRKKSNYRGNKTAG